MNELFEHYPKRVLERFKKWHKENPEVFTEFKQLAFQMRDTGRKKYGAKAIIEVLRWHRNLATKEEVFKLNNDYISIYARLLIHHHPEMASFFELRVDTQARGIKSAEQQRREMETDQ